MPRKAKDQQEHHPLDLESVKESVRDAQNTPRFMYIHVKYIFIPLMALLVLISGFFRSVEADNPEVKYEVVTIYETQRIDDIKLLFDIMLCESGGKWTARNENSSASGLFQFVDSTAEDVHQEVYGYPLDYDRKNDPRVQVDMAVWLYENEGPTPWECYTEGMI